MRILEVGDAIVFEPQQYFRLPWSVRWPVELHRPAGFDPADPRTWPRIDGRMEFVGGRLLYMPPCGEEHSVVAARVAQLIGNWRDAHPGFDVGSHDAGMLLGGDVRGPDVGVWIKKPGTARSRRYRSSPPILAIEVAGADDAENEEALRAKADWYFAHGVRCVWLVLPATRELVVLQAQGEARLREGDVVPAPPELPGLSVPVAAMFATL